MSRKICLSHKACGRNAFPESQPWKGRRATCRKEAKAEHTYRWSRCPSEARCSPRRPRSKRWRRTRSEGSGLPAVRWSSSRRPSAETISGLVKTLQTVRSDFWVLYYIFLASVIYWSINYHGNMTSTPQLHTDHRRRWWSLATRPPKATFEVFEVTIHVLNIITVYQPEKHWMKTLVSF